jgi:radical SAM protein with 4Fe4S-binding SPASM domain
MISANVENETINDVDWIRSRLNKRFVVPNWSDIVVKEKGGEYLFIDRLRAKWWRTDSVGKLVFDLCNNNLTIGEVCDKIVSEYNLSKDIIIYEISLFLRKAISREYLIPAEEQKRTFDKQKTTDLEESPRLDQIAMLFLEVTERCQLQCPFCYAGPSNPREKEELTLEEYARLLEDPIVNNARRIILTGGEPTLRKDLLDIAKLIKSKNHKITLISNGICQDYGLWQELANCVDAIQISIDGPTAKVHDRFRGKGNFEKTVAVAKFLSSTDLKNLYIAMTPSQSNVKFLPDMVNFAYDIGANLLHISVLMEADMARQNSITLDRKQLTKAVKEAYANELRQRAWTAGSAESKVNLPFSLVVYADQITKVMLNVKRTSCSLGCGTIRIDSYGNVFPCTHFRNTKFSQGSIRQEGFEKVFGRMKIWASGLQVDSLIKCKSCELKYICGGGCRASAEAATGDIRGLDPACESIRERLYDHMWNIDL